MIYLKIKYLRKKLDFEKLCLIHFVVLGHFFCQSTRTSELKKISKKKNFQQDNKAKNFVYNTWPLKEKPKII